MVEAALLIFNLFILEALLSVDNAAVLSIMVKDLPKHQQGKALKYGLLGAFGFRGLSLFFITFLIKIYWLKIVGGLYLCYLFYSHFSPQKDSLEDGIDKDKNKIFKWAKNKIGLFWSTVILVEFVDIAFSIDNVFAAVAMTTNITLIFIGVFMGIIAMRFIAQWFVVLIGKYKTLEASAFIIILLLGLKLITGGILDYTDYSNIKGAINSHNFDMFFSLSMIVIFFLPLIFKKKKDHEHVYTKIIYENGVKFYQCSVKGCSVIDLER